MKKIYGVGCKIKYAEIIRHLFKADEIVTHYAIIKVRYFFCSSFEEACEKYKKLNLTTSYYIYDVYKLSEKYDWFCKRYRKISEELIQIEVVCSIDELKENMTYTEYKAWLDSVMKEK